MRVAPPFSHGNGSACAAIAVVGELPSIEDFVSVLQKCRTQRDLCHGSKVYALLCNNGLETITAVGNHVIPLFVDCGGMQAAEKAFRKLAFPNVHAWTSILSGLVEQKKFDDAFDLYKNMKGANVQPSSYTFVVLLKACSMLKDVRRGQEMHAQSAETGFKEDVFINSSLMEMYFQCGLPAEARGIFNNLYARDVGLWNTLIAGYVEHRFAEEALMCFEQMRQGDCSPNVVTYACSLKACACLKGLHEGRELHVEIVQRFLETDPLMGNALIDLYAKCTSLSEAQAVFDQMLNRDVVSWNALITGQVEHGCHQEALRSFTQMQFEGILPDSVTFVCCLRACASLGELEVGRSLDAQTSWAKSQGDIFIGNTLVDMYAKCGCLQDAQKAFDELGVQDVVSWNALIAGYAEHGPFDAAIGSFDTMGSRNVVRDATTYVCVLKACSNSKALEKGRKVHLEIAQKGLETHLFVGSTLIEFYGRCGAVGEAEDIFERLPAKDVSSWNALIAGYVEQQSYQKALSSMETMQSAYLSPNPVTFSSCLKACRGQEDVVTGRRLHSEASRLGIDDDSFVGSALVKMYAECDALTDARSCFERLPFRDIPSWNSLVAGYVACGNCQEALDLYQRMHGARAIPNEVTFVCVLKACGSMGSVEKGHAIHAALTKRGFVYTPYLGNTLLDMYAKCGSISEAWGIFATLQVRDVTSWNTIIKGYGVKQDGNVAMRLFEDMKKHGKQPDAITFTCLLTACSRSSLLREGREVFELMSDEFGIAPSIQHYNCIIDLHARSGCVHEAQKFLLTMPSSPSKVLWTVLLNACKNFVKQEMGSWCFQELVHTSAECATAYMLMADIYAAVGRCNHHTHDVGKAIETRWEEGHIAIDIHGGEGRAVQALRYVSLHS